MRNEPKMNALSQLALRSLLQASLQVDVGSVPCTQFDCKRWRSNGFSDCEIYQLNSSIGTFAIRSWPSRVESPSKVNFWNNLNASFAEAKEDLKAIGAANAAPFPLLHHWSNPGERPALLLAFENRLWTLSAWVGGESMTSSVVDKETVHHLATVLGRMHAKTLVASDSNRVPLGRHVMESNSIRDRMKALQLLDHRLFTAIDRSAFLSNAHLSDKVKHCIATVFERQSDWERFLNICAAQERECHWIVRDLWRENVLLDGDNRFASIVDLGASRMDWPGLDFIRLFGSLAYVQESHQLRNQQRGADLWKDAYAAYTQENCEHSIHSLDECKMLHLVSSGLSILQWAVWITDGTLSDATQEKAKRIANRIAELSDRFLIESMQTT